MGSRLLQAMKPFLLCLSIVLGLYCPALLLLLPDCIFDLQNEYDKEDVFENQLENELPNREQTWSDDSGIRDGYERIQNEEENRQSCNTEEIPVDDPSPVTCSTFLLGCVQLLPDLKMSFNLKLAVLMFFIFPFSFYFQLALFFALKPKYVNERLKLPLSESQEFSAINLFMISPSTILVFLTVVLPCLTTVFFLKPKDLFLTDCRLCDRVYLHSVSIGNETLHHLKLFPEEGYILFLVYRYLHRRGQKILACYSKKNYRGSRMRRALLRLWLIFPILFTLFLGLVWAVICLFLLLVSVIFLAFKLSPAITLPCCVFTKILTKISSVRNRISGMSFILCRFLFILLYIYMLFVAIFLLYGVFTLCTFFAGILGFTTMGLALNAEIVTPYVSFLVVVTTNVYFCYANLQRNYMEVKEFILKYRQQELDSISGADQSTIPTNLFWSVSDEVLPVTTEVCLMLRDVAVIATFLFLTISSIIFFRNEYEISTLVSIIAVFISGAIPTPFLKGLTRGKNFSGWRKIQLERKIKVAVREYEREVNSVGKN